MAKCPFLLSLLLRVGNPPACGTSLCQTRPRLCHHGATRRERPRWWLRGPGRAGNGGRLSWGEGPGGGAPDGARMELYWSSHSAVGLSTWGGFCHRLWWHGKVGPWWEVLGGGGALWLDPGVPTERIKQGKEGDGGCSVGRRSVRANTPQAIPARCHGKSQPQLCGARPCDLLTEIPAPGSSGNPTREPRSWQWVRKRGWHLGSPGSCPMA